MERDELVAEISMRKDVPMETVDEVLEGEEEIVEEEYRRIKKRKCICTVSTILVFILGAVATLIILDKKDKIDIEEAVKNYMEKITGR